MNDYNNFVGWTFMYRKYGMSRAHGCAGATMSTGPNIINHEQGGHECPPYLS